MDICSITGRRTCTCDGTTPISNYIKTDLKAVLRKLFTDHVTYTNWLITASLPVLQPDVQPLIDRLLENPADIANLLLHIIGKESADVVEKVITDHLILANDALTAVREGDEEAVSIAVDDFYTQSDKFAAALSSLNPAKLPIDFAITMVKSHNEHVVHLAVLRSQRKYGEYINSFDDYYKHMLMFSDAVYETTTM